MISDLISAPFCNVSLLWLAAIENTPHFTVEEVCCLGKIDKILCKLLSCQPSQAFDYDVPAVKKSRRLYGHYTYQVSELLSSQSKALGESVLRHISEARARGANSLVNARLASIYRSLNFERLAIFKDRDQVLLILELLVRIGTQTASGREWTRLKFTNMPQHQREAITLYLDATLEQVMAEDTPLAKIEEMRRHVNVQLAQQSMNMEEELHKHRVRLNEMLRANKRLRQINDRNRAIAVHEEVVLLRWELSLLEHIMVEGTWPVRMGKENWKEGAAL